MPASERDERRFMAQALALAARADGSTSPNPRVGCVLVQRGTVVGAGLHQGPGSAHAESMAIAAAAGDTVGATAYVTLEPCAHHGRTPPCVEALLNAGVTRVVAAIEDPDPRVHGRGFEQLRGAGVEVEIGLLGAQAEALNAGFLRWHRTGRPLVTLKAGLSLDGQLAASCGVSRWITSAAARLAAHRLRWSHDALLVGAETVRRDNPRLSVRLDGQERRRLVVILSRSLKLDPAARVFRDAEPEATRIYTAASTPTTLDAALTSRATLVRVAATATGLALGEVLEDLARQGVQSLLVEGGGQTFYRFLEQGLAQRGALFQAPLALAAGGATPWLNGPTVATPQHGWNFKREQVIALGPDQLTLGVWTPTGKGA